MAIGRKPRIELGDVTPPAALTEATEEKVYFSARVPASVVEKFERLRLDAKERHGFKFFMQMVDFYEKHHPLK